MNILIKGMEMPKGKEIVLRIDEKGEVYVYGSYPTELHKAVPVPPHGDLIDRGYAIASACSGLIRTLPTTDGGGDWIRVAEVRESIKSAPTIIEADFEEEEMK